MATERNNRPTGNKNPNTSGSRSSSSRTASSNGSRSSGMASGSRSTSTNRSTSSRSSGTASGRRGPSSVSRSTAGSSTRRTNSKEYALDKFDADISAAPARKRKKTPKSKNPFKRMVVAMFPQPGDAKGEIARKVILLVAIAVLIGTLAFLIWQMTGVEKGGQHALSIAASANAPMDSSAISYSQPGYVENPPAEIRTTAGDEEPEYIDLTPVVNTPLNVDFNYLREQNPDVRGWVKVQGTLINNVVMADTDGSQFYIDHDINREESISGEIFSSWRNKWDGTDDNIVLFGHNMKSGYFFAYVNHYVPNDASREPLAFYKVHPTIMLQRDGGECEVYKVFAGFVANTDPQYGEVFDYTTRTQFNSADEFNQYILDVMDRSWFYTDVDLTYGDKLLTLSTCYWPLGRNIPTRFAVVARKVRPGESEYVDTSVAQRNWGAKLFEHYYNTWGGQWYGSNWDTSKLLSY